MNYNRSIQLLVLALLAACLCSCPKSSDDTGSNAMPGGDAAAGTNPCAEQATDVPGQEADMATEGETADAEAGQENPCADTDMSPEQAMKFPVEAMAEAMRDYYGAGFRNCFHPESPALEAQVEHYNAWKKLNQSIEISKLELKEHTEDFALLDYEFVYTQRPQNTEVSRENGSVEVTRNEEGKWVILDFAQN